MYCGTHCASTLCSFALPSMIKKKKKKNTWFAKRLLEGLLTTAPRTKALMSGASCVYVDHKKCVESLWQSIHGSTDGTAFSTFEEILYRTYDGQSFFTQAQCDAHVSFNCLNIL